MSPRLLCALGLLVFIGLPILASANRRAIEWRTVASGLALQFALGLFVLNTTIGQAIFARMGDAVNAMLDFTREGSRMVFGEAIVDEGALGFVFAFEVLPTVIFISSFFTLLYHLGVLQLLVKAMAWIMMKLMRVSGAESLTSAANVFMGHTEAPLIVRPYIESMTRSEILTMMIAGMSTISGGVMAAYIGLGIDARALLTASVMAAPGALVITKILWPETGEPLTRGVVRVRVERTAVNFVDALAQGASEGMKLSLNIAAMLIAFLAMMALVDGLLGLIDPELTLTVIFSWIFAPISYLIGITGEEAPQVASLLGTKLVLNEFVAFANLVELQDSSAALSPRSAAITTFALCGFANVGAVGIQLGGIGALAPTRRGDLAQLAFRALFGGFLASLVNASIAGMLLA